MITKTYSTRSWLSHRRRKSQASRPWNDHFEESTGLMQGGPIDSSKWSFQGLLACDFLRRCDSQLRVLYVFVIMEVGTRRIAHCNVTTHPSADAPAVSGDHHGRETVPGSSSTTATTFTPPNSIRP